MFNFRALAVNEKIDAFISMPPGTSFQRVKLNQAGYKICTLGKTSLSG
jgi:hypothetical protein